MAETQELEAAECQRLLRGGVVGRVALATPTGPHIVPVNYSVVDDAIIFRTTPYSVLGTYGRNAQLAFEVDYFDYENHRGWSVMVRGRGDTVIDQDLLQRIREVWPPRPWADGVRNAFFRLPCTEVSGRRLGRGWTRDNEMPVHRSLSAM